MCIWSLRSFKVKWSHFMFKIYFFVYNIIFYKFSVFFYFLINSLSLGWICVLPWPVLRIQVPTLAPALTRILYLSWACYHLTVNLLGKGLTFLLQHFLDFFILSFNVFFLIQEYVLNIYKDLIRFVRVQAK